MTITLLSIFDLVGTIAFAISGTYVGIHKDMDIFGVNVLSMTTACGGGLIRDVLIGNIPPNMFLNPFYVFTALIIANVIFVLEYKNKRLPSVVAPVYEKLLFCFDTLGLAAFTVDGVTIGVEAGYGDRWFLLVFLGFMTGVGGGALRDILADQTPDIFVKHIYALAAIAGGLTMVILFGLFESEQVSMLGGFFIVLLLRIFARKYQWNLPRINHA